MESQLSEPVSLISDQGVLEVPWDARPAMVPLAEAWNDPIVMQTVSHRLILEREGN